MLLDLLLKESPLNPMAKVKFHLCSNEGFAMENGEETKIKNGKERNTSDPPPQQKIKHIPE